VSRHSKGGRGKEWRGVEETCGGRGVRLLDESGGWAGEEPLGGRD
jgi:hypothetical protein